MKNVHLMLTPRSRNPIVIAKLAEACQAINQLTIPHLKTDDRVSIEIAQVISDLVDVERYLQEPWMDWRGPA
jgi:hypothetical protein